MVEEDVEVGPVSEKGLDEEEAGGGWEGPARAAIFDAMPILMCGSQQ